MLSTRTPEGQPLECPVCNMTISALPSEPCDDAPCPNCGVLLWFDGDSFLLHEEFTTGQAAKLCNVSQQAIIRCVDNGSLKGYRVPGRRFRRILRDDLRQFMEFNGIPTDALGR